MADDKPAGKGQPDRPPTLAEAARVLVKDAKRGILCTLIPEGGFPYGSLTEILPLPDGDIVLFLSRLAEHQHFLAADPRASIVVVPAIDDADALLKPRVTWSAAPRWLRTRPLMPTPTPRGTRTPAATSISRTSSLSPAREGPAPSPASARWAGSRATPIAWRNSGASRRHFIDSHKGVTPLAILAMMAVYDQWDNPTAWVYLGLHGSYGILWVLKSRIFGDRQWEQPTGSGLRRHLGRADAVLDHAVADYLAGRTCAVLAVGPERVRLRRRRVPPLRRGHAEAYVAGAAPRPTDHDRPVGPGRLLNYLGELLIYLSLAVLDCTGRRWPSWRCFWSSSGSPTCGARIARWRDIPLCGPQKPQLYAAPQAHGET